MHFHQVRLVVLNDKNLQSWENEGTWNDLTSNLDTETSSLHILISNVIRIVRYTGDTFSSGPSGLTSLVGVHVLTFICHFLLFFLQFWVLISTRMFVLIIFNIVLISNTLYRTLENICQSLLRSVMVLVKIVNSMLHFIPPNSIVYINNSLWQELIEYPLSVCYTCLISSPMKLRFSVIREIFYDKHTNKWY